MGTCLGGVFCLGLSCFLPFFFDFFGRFSNISFVYCRMSRNNVYFPAPVCRLKTPKIKGIDWFFGNLFSDIFFIGSAIIDIFFIFSNYLNKSGPCKPSTLLFLPDHSTGRLIKNR